MLRRCIGIAFAVLVVTFASVQTAEAQWSCGTITRTHNGWQQPNRARYQIQVSTEREVAVCPFIVHLQTEAWIHGYGADVHRDTWAAHLNVTAGVPTDQWANSTGKHWLIINLNRTGNLGGRIN